MERIPRVHWLRGNKGERTPRRIIILDTESRLLETEPREVHGLRCWVARVIVRSETPGKLESCAQSEGTERQEITDLITATVKPKFPYRLFTHNLSYDLGLTRLPLALIEQGWEVGKHNLASDQPWAYMKRGGRGLWLCDSWGWLPQSVESLGEKMGRAKLKLPNDDAPLELWLRRCRRDVEIQSTALLQLMDEWDRRRLGWWSITGPASGWNTMLHFPARSLPPEAKTNVAHSHTPTAHRAGPRTLIVPDADARQFERQALYSGRRDIWRVGDLGTGPWAEVDLQNTHLVIVASYLHPYRRWEPFDSLPLDDWRLCNPGAGLVARVVVRTGTPRYPLRHSGVVLHPVGRFQTVLAGPEIIEAKRRGELESIGFGYGYHLGETMKEWAQWCLAVLNSGGGDVAPMLKVAVKPWGRNVPGRWGMTHARAIKSGPSHIQDWALEPITVGNPPRRGSIFHMAGKWTESVNDQESDDSFPAVLAYVQSYCRLALNRLLDALPESDLVSCNTEGAWVSFEGLGRVPIEPAARGRFLPNPNRDQPASLAALSQVTAPLTVQLKQTAQRLVALSPQHIQADDHRQFSGIPSSAQLQPDGRYSFLTWPKLRGQIERGDPRGYVRERRTVNLAGLPVSRWAFEDGACEPVETAWSPLAGNSILPPSDELRARHGALRPVQHPVLRKVLAGTL